MKNLKYILPVGLLAFASNASAQLAGPAGDVEALVGGATTVFTAVAALSLTMIGFYLIVRVVKGIKK